MTQSLHTQCNYCKKFYSEEPHCPHCGTKRGAKKPPFETNLQIIIISIIGGILFLVFLIVFLLLNSYCNPINGQCGISEQIAAWQATQTPNMSETIQAERTITAQANATETQLVNINNTAIVNVTETAQQISTEFANGLVTIEANRTSTLEAQQTTFAQSTATRQFELTTTRQFERTRRVESTYTAIANRTLEQNEIGQFSLTLAASRQGLNTEIASDLELQITNQVQSISQLQAEATHVQQEIVEPLQSNATRVQDTLNLANTELASTRPDHFVAHAVNQIAYFTYDNGAFPLFIEDTFIVLVVSCCGAVIMAIFVGGIAGIVSLVKN